MLEIVMWAWHTVLGKSAQKKINGIPIAVKEGLSSSWEQRTVMSQGCPPVWAVSDRRRFLCYGELRSWEKLQPLSSPPFSLQLQLDPHWPEASNLPWITRFPSLWITRFPSLWDPCCVMEWYRCPQGKTCSWPSHGSTALPLYGCMRVPDWLTLETTVSSSPFCVPQLLKTLF